jgi:serine/threonine protein kinase
MNQNAAQREADENEALRQEIKGRLGKIVGERWRLMKYIGVGASAAVYQGEDVERLEPVAVKILHSRFVNSRIVRQRFVREQQIMDQIRHPNVLRIDCTGVTEADEPFMVMELLEGCTLEKVMKRSPQGLPPLEVANYMVHTLEALAFCHSKGIIHRDLKPANIFLTKKNVIKVLDFGVARFHMEGLQQLTRDGTALGTPAFMSPEQATGRLDSLDVRSDIFSVGATMHYMLSGSFLHQGRTADETFVMAATTPAPSLARRAPNLPLALVRLVDRAVAWAPDDRWPDCFEMLSALRQLMLDGVLGVDGLPQADASPSIAVAPISAPQIATPQVERQREALVSWWRAMPPTLEQLRQHGPQHRQVAARLDEAVAALGRIVRELPHARLDLHITPTSIVFEGQPCWEPESPWWVICRSLHVAHIQTLRISGALTGQSLGMLCALCLHEPGPNHPVEDDLLTALWERPLPGITIKRQRLAPVEPFAEALRFEREVSSRVAELEQAMRQDWAWQQAHHKRLAAHKLAPPEESGWLDTPEARNRADGTSASISGENLERLMAMYQRQGERAPLHYARMLADVWTDAVIEGDEARIARVWAHAIEAQLRERGPLESMALLAGVLARTHRPEARIALNTQIIERALLPHLAGYLQAPIFHTSPAAHRKSFLNLMRQLAPQTTDQVALELVRSTAQNTAPPGWDTTRAVAAEYLGEFGPLVEAKRALEIASRQTPWNGPEVRAAAASALALRTSQEAR